MTDELRHHGIVGMRWGVRRYQNYDGTYTQKGVERYKKAEAKYRSTAEQVKTAKKNLKDGSGSRLAVASAKRTQRDAKRELNKAYDRLKTDKLADQGRELYKNGKTIIGNNSALAKKQLGVVLGSYALQKGLDYVMLNKHGVYASKEAKTLIAAGGTFVNIVMTAQNSSDNRKIRAYYAH